MMMSNGIIKELTGIELSPNEDRVRKGSMGPSKSRPSESTSMGGVWLKFPFLACVVTAAVVFVLVQNANRHGFERDFQVLSRKITDAFFYETHMKIHAIQDASVAASRIFSMQTAQWGALSKRRKAMSGQWPPAPDELSLQMFYKKTRAMQQFAQIDQLIWHPLDLEAAKAKKKEKETGYLTCETERTCKGGHVRGEAVNIIEESKTPITSEVFVSTPTGRGDAGFQDIKTKGGEQVQDIKTTVFYPVIDHQIVPLKHADKQQTLVVGAVAAEIKWEHFFSPSTFQPENEGLVIAVENTCGQAYTYRIKDGIMTFLGKGYIFDEEFSDMMVVSDYSDFVKPGISKILHSRRPGTEDWFCGCEYRIRLYPSREMRDRYTASWPKMFVMGATLSLLTLFLSFLAYDIYVSRRYSHVTEHLSRYNTIVGSLFPDVVLDRVVEENLGVLQCNKFGFHGEGFDTSDIVLSNRFLADYQVPMDNITAALTEKPIFNSFSNTSICFMDVAGFTAWSSERDPEQVFMLLESVYQRFDRIASRIKVFKIETIGDCYVAVTGVPEPQRDHCLLMARFSYECMFSFTNTIKELEMTLGPGTTDLALRVGIHSGPVIAGVLRAEKVRFQLFGDTMNTASRMESTGKPGMVQLSRDSAVLLEAAGKADWLEKRNEVVAVKGKGNMTTYWLKMSQNGTKLNTANGEAVSLDDELNADGKSSQEESAASRRERLINWNTEVLLQYLRKVVARRRAMDRRGLRLCKQNTGPERDVNYIEYQKFIASRSLMDHVADEIPFASFEEDLDEEDSSKINLGPEVEAQLRAYVAECASLYNDVPFHNFEHASHVVMSSKKLLNRIISPVKGGFQQLEKNALGGIKKSREFHDSTYGISCDPLMHFAMIQASLIHDLGHQGLTNKQLVQKNKEMAARYNGKSVAEQHSLNLAMHVFADHKYSDLRKALLADDPDETQRYYQFLLSSVLATDIADKELKEARQQRWDKAFEEEKKAKFAKDQLKLDSFYLGELNRVDIHFRWLALASWVTWFALVVISYWVTPEENLEVLGGVEQKAAGVAFSLLAVSYVYKLVPQFLKVLDLEAEPMSGVVMGVITIETIAMITDGLMAFGFKTPVLIDPVCGNRVHLLRWCEWTPLAFYIYFITDGVDVPDREVGLKSKYFFAGCQGLSTFAGFLFPFATNTIVWVILCFFSCVLFLFLYVHLAYKRKVFARLQRGVSADDKEIYDRSRYSLQFLESVGLTWGILVFMYFLEGFGPMVSSVFDFTRAEGFGMIWTSIFDCCSKMNYMNHIMDINTLVFDTKERAKRQKAESIRLKHESNRKATILFEYIIQASDVAHCMQHWNVYQRFNRKLFEEMFTAYLKCDSEDDPRTFWYKGEIWFFDNYIIPLAQKLEESGVFGASGSEYLRCAVANRNEWEVKGQDITANMIAEFEEKLCSGNEPNIKTKEDKLLADHRSDASLTPSLAETDCETDSSEGGSRNRTLTVGGNGGNGFEPLKLFCRPRLQKH